MFHHCTEIPDNPYAASLAHLAAHGWQINDPLFWDRFSGSSGLLLGIEPFVGRLHQIRCATTGQDAGKSNLRRSNHRTAKDLNSTDLITGLNSLLSWCSWICGASIGRKCTVSQRALTIDPITITPASMQRRFNATPLHRYQNVRVHDLLEKICRHSDLPRMPELYYIADPTLMNAYALGNRSHSAIILTGGLLEKLTEPELGAIVAHEVAHICNSDSWTLNFAASLQSAICAMSVFGLANHNGALLTSQNALFLRAAPAVGELLCLALSRVREFAADALSLELTDEPHALASALEKLERHHSPQQLAAASRHDDYLPQFLCSHPSTGERVDALLCLA